MRFIKSDYKNLMLRRSQVFPKNKTLRIMRMLSILLLVICLQAGATGYGQRLSVVGNDMTLENVFKKIEKQSGFLFFYADKDIKLDMKTTINVKKTGLQKVLQVIFKDLPYTYEIIGKTIVVKNKKHSVVTGISFRDEKDDARTITGRVTDQTGNPLEGVSVTIKGTNKGTTTNAQGIYSIEIQDEKSILVFSMVGYAKTEIEPKSESIDIVLQQQDNDLNEIVVVGYGTQQRANLTGATTVVDSKLLQDRPVSNVSNLLQGSVPNLEVKFSTGRPGASGGLNIRGVNSISSSARPLVIIDGFEGNIDRLNPNDIESITVLKDASASAVYGARASYGVLIVTTKSGSKGAPSISYSGMYSFSKPTTSTDYETRGYYSARINDLFFKNYGGTPYTNYNDDDYYELWIRRNDKTENPERPWVTVQNRDGRDSYIYYANTDWYNYLFDDSRPLQNHNVSLNGSSDKIDYSVSGNYVSQDGIFRMNTDNYKRYNFRSKVNFHVKKWLDFNTNVSYFKSKYAYPGPGGVENLFNSMVSHGLSSLVPENPDGSLVYTTTISNYQLMDGYTALIANGKHHNLDQVAEFSPTFEAVLKPAKGLDIRTSYRFTQTNLQNMNRSVNIPYSKYPGEISEITTGIGINNLYQVETTHEYQAVNTYATYQWKIHEDHDFKLMGGFNYETKYLRDVKAKRDGLLSDQLDDFQIAAGDVMDISGGQNEYATFGTFYRLNYGFRNKYLFEAAGRYDGTSRFAKGQRYGFFPSFSAAWRIEQEGFFKDWNQSVINNAKLRVSYGSLGNQQVGYYDYIQTISTGGNLSYTFGDGTLAQYAVESAPNSSSLTWEKVNTTNLGTDLGLFGNKMNVTADVYWRETIGMLTAGKKIPAYYGASIPKENASDLMTKGWELSISWRDAGMLFNKPFNYNIGVGIGDNTTTITRFDNPNKNLANFYKGQRLGQIWGYIVDGYFQSDEEAQKYDVDQRSVNNIINTSAIDPGVHAGDLKFVDLDGDKVISVGDNTADNPGDRKVIGNSLPRYNYNATLGASWNNIDVSVFIQGIGHQDWYPDPNAMGFWGPYSRPYVTFIPRDFMSKVWSEDNPNAFFPRPRGYIALNAGNRSLGVTNNKYLQNVAYARLKNVTVGYSIPAELLNRIGFTRFRIYFSGENLATITGLQSKYIDPEQASASNTYNTSSSRARTYPWAKTFSFGLDITL